MSEATAEQSETPASAPTAASESENAGEQAAVADQADGKNFFETVFGGLTVSKPHSKNPSAKYSPAYAMNHKRRGVCVIFNQVRFEKHTGLSERKGSDVDANNLSDRFKQLGFEVQLYSDKTCETIRNLLKNLAKQNHTDDDCFVCCFLSHGEDKEILYASNGQLRVSELTEQFKGDKCLSLAGKPKLFFIQACRGFELDHGTLTTDSGSKSEQVRIPAEADFLIAYSTVSGYYSWRNAVRGSWFVQALNDVILEFADKVDLLTMMTMVNAKVAYDFESQATDESMRNKKQMPCIVSMLTKQVWFCNQPDIIVPLS